MPEKQPPIGLAYQRFDIGPVTVYSDGLVTVRIIGVQGPYTASEQRWNSERSRVLDAAFVYEVTSSYETKPELVFGLEQVQAAAARMHSNYQRDLDKIGAIK
ncbi:MAG: hypothetical protein E6Q97_07470 [Desulfurellales bacterium]|nr:MAG: hypothetical protein E6Q97_07470 [Desulfurellales bacterium]